MENTNKYQNGKIYKLFVDDPAEPWFYIGSTTQSLINRRIGHKQKAKQCPDNKMYKILNGIGWHKVKMVLIEVFPGNTKFELTDRENKYITENMENPYLLNIQFASLKAGNIDEINKYQSYDRIKRANTTETPYILQQKEYRMRTKEHRKEYDEEYRKRNDEYITMRRKIKIVCICGQSITKSHIRRHENESRIHREYLNNTNNSLSILTETYKPR